MNLFRLNKLIRAGMSILHVAEKNSIAKEVSNILSNNNRRNIPSRSKYNPIY